MDFYLFFFLFVFHKEFLVISHNFNDQVYTIIIAQPNLDNQIGAIERVDINPQPLFAAGLYARAADVYRSVEEIEVKMIVFISGRDPFEGGKNPKNLSIVKTRKCCQNNSK